MIRKEYTIIAEEGLHARPASLLSAAASKVPGTVDIEFRGKRYTLKSIMIVLSLGVPKGADIAIIVDSEDEETHIINLEKVLLENHLI
jgi:phosphocarrier protein